MASHVRRAKGITYSSELKALRNKNVLCESLFKPRGPLLMEKRLPRRK